METHDDADKEGLFEEAVGHCGADSKKILGGFAYCGSDGKESAFSAGDPGSIPGSGGSCVEGNGYPLQYSCLENSMDRGAWWATVHGVTKSQTRLNN